MDSSSRIDFADRIPVGRNARIVASLCAVVLVYSVVVPLFAALIAPSYAPLMHTLIFVGVYLLSYALISHSYCLHLRLESIAEPGQRRKQYLTIVDPGTRYHSRIAVEDIQSVRREAYRSSYWRALLGLPAATPTEITSSVHLPDYRGEALIITYRYSGPFEEEPQRVVLQLPCEKMDELIALLPQPEPTMGGTG